MSAEPAKRDVVLIAWLLLLVPYAFICAQYVYRTSFEHSGERVFVLWDDAMISMQYAKNLVDHGELVWSVDGERVLGISNFGVALLMTLIHLLPLSLQKTSLVFQIMNFAFLASTIYLAGRLCESLYESRWAGAGTAVVCALYGPLTIWSLQGSDTGVLSLLAVSAFLVLVRAHVQREEVPTVMYVLLASGVVMRLDFSIVYVLFLLFAFLAKRDTKRALRLGIPVLLGTWAALFAFNAIYYGEALPNTYFLKATGTPRGLMLANGWYQVKQLFAGPPLVPFVLFVQSVIVGAVRRRFVLTLVATIGAFLAYAIWIGGDWATLHAIRFVVPIMPLYIVVLVGGSFELVRIVFSDRPLSLQKTIFAGYVVSIGWLSNPRATLHELYSPDAIPMYHAENHANYRYADYFCRMTTPETTIGVFWAGITPYFCERPYVDVLGKSDAHIAKLEVDRFFPGHSKWDWNYVLNVRRVDVLSSESPELRIHEDYQRDFCTTRGEFIYHLRYESRDKINGETPSLCVTGSMDVCVPCSGRKQPVHSLYDFEDGRLSGWEVEGTAFGAMGVYDPRQRLPGQSPVTGYRGLYLVSSFHPNDDGTGVLRSPPFEILADAIRLRVGGGRRFSNELYVGLEVDGQLVESATGHDSESLRVELWDVTPFQGRMGRLVIVDRATGPWGHILVDAVDWVARE